MSMQRGESIVGRADQDGLFMKDSINARKSILSLHKFNDIVDNAFGEAQAKNSMGDEQQYSSIFAINSDVSFLYIIGKMC